MFSIINQYSFLLTTIFFTISLQLFIWRFFPNWIKTFSLINIFAALLIVSTVIIINQNSNESSLKDLSQDILPNKPVLLYFYSDMWIACLLAKSAVSSLEKQIIDECDLIRVEIRSEYGRIVREKYKSDVIPAFLLLNKQGDEIFRKNGTPPTKTKLLSIINSTKPNLPNWT